MDDVRKSVKGDVSGSGKVYTSNRPTGRTIRKEECERNVKSSIPC